MGKFGMRRATGNAVHGTGKGDIIVLRNSGCGRRSVQASLDWLAGSGAEFSPGVGHSGFAHLKHYTARYCIWGKGRPLVLVPGLAGGFELLGPLARLLAEDFQVISYQLR